MAVKPKQYTVLVGFNYPPDDQRANVGDVVELPDIIAQDLLPQGAVELVKPTRSAKAGE